MPMFLVFLRFKVFLSYAAKRAHPIIGYIFECSSRLNAIIRITYFGIVNVSAYFANVLLHSRLFK